MALRHHFGLLAPFDHVTYPDSGLEADGKSALEDEKHSGGADTCCVWWESECQRSVSKKFVWAEFSILTSDAGFVLDLIDECGLDYHHRCHHSDHG